MIVLYVLLDVLLLSWALVNASLLARWKELGITRGVGMALFAGLGVYVILLCKVTSMLMETLKNG